MTSSTFIKPTPEQQRIAEDRMKQGEFTIRDIANVLENANVFTPTVMARSIISKLYRTRFIKLHNGKYIWNEERT